MSEVRDPKGAPVTDSWGGETDWGLIAEASGPASDVARDRAWERLVRCYRIPVLRSLRRCLQRHDATPEVADDFFGYLFEARVLPKARRGQGRFRCYVQGVIRRFAAQRRRASDSAAEDVDEIELEDAEQEPEIERQEEHEWAQAVLEHALVRVGRGAPRDVDLLTRTYGLFGAAPVSGSELARALGITPNALHVALHRARERLHEALAAELALLVSDEAHLRRELDVFVARLLEAHPGLIHADAAPRAL